MRCRAERAMTALAAVAIAGCGETASVAPWQDAREDGGLVDSPSRPGDGSASGEGEATTGDGAASGEGGTPRDGGPGGDASDASDAGWGGEAGGDATGDEGDAGMTTGPRWLGRVDATDPSAVRFAWSASGLTATVRGSTISVSLATETPDSDGGGAGPIYFQPVIDRKPGARFSVSGPRQTVVLGKGLSAGPHTVELYRETEAEIEDVLYVSVFYGFVDGQVVGAPARSGRLIEVVGDSISCGYGNLCKGPAPFSVDTESAYQAYGPQLARALSADVSIVAHSGWGVYRDLSGNTAKVMPAVYGNTVGTAPLPAWDFSAQPDAIVVNLGTNDSAQGDPGTPYETAYVAFLQTLRARNPSAWIFLTIGPMTADPELTMMRDHLANVIATFGDSRVAQAYLATQNTASVGCDYHPTADEDTTMADALAPAIRAKLGW
jgi:lysophospholipase L1-like esterase